MEKLIVIKVIGSIADTKIPDSSVIELAKLLHLYNSSSITHFAEDREGNRIIIGNKAAKEACDALVEGAASISEKSLKTV